MTSNVTAAAALQQPSPPSLAALNASVKVGIATLTLAFLLGFPGNLFVVWTILCRVKKRSVTCLLVLNLALADALVLLSAPVFLRYLAGGRGWELGSAGCKLVHYLSSVNMYVSIYLICLMSVDRWLAVTRPFLSQRMRSKRGLLFVLLGVWTLAFLLSVPMPFYRSVEYKTLPGNATLRLCNPHHYGRAAHKVFQYLFESVLGFLVPFLLINACYSAVVCRLRSAKFQRRRQGSRLILLIVCAFAAFWLPYHVVNLIEVGGHLQGDSSAITAAERARPNVTALAFFSSAINPILYVFAGSSHIRRAGLGFMGKLFEATNSESSSKSTSTFSRSARTCSSNASPEDKAKLGNPFKSKAKQRDVQGGGVDELTTMTGGEQVE
ncbi:leukotriene B4 receptor 1 [Brachionichthys hirsutus]|uniref:leukotriene B4 receptor 1 n=1 Tax=Brachionichthys hirsutus TaxID=412623 RepID=UPI003604AFDD